MIDSAKLAGLMLVLLLLWPVYNLVLALFAWWSPRPASRAARETAQPTPFWIVIPALNEERVVAATVRAALALDHPKTPVRLVVVDDGSDDATPAVLAAITDPRLRVLRRSPPKARLGKGAALNAAYALIRDTTLRDGTFDRCIVGVIDGDGRGSRGLLLEVSEYFADPGVAAVQCRVRIHNRDRLLAFLQDLEFGCVASASQSLRDALGSAELGGNGQFVRLRSLARLGRAPWSGCLVEDLELGLRLHLTDQRIRYASHATITQQGLVDLRRIVRQRTRWCQGNLQCSRFVPKLIGTHSVTGPALLEYLYYLLAPWLIVPVSLAVFFLVGLTVTGLIAGEDFGGFVASGTAGPLSLVVWLGALFTPGLVWGLVHQLRHGDERLRRTLLVGILYPAFLLIGIVASWRALGRHMAGRQSWAKTERLIEEPDDLVFGADPTLETAQAA